VPTGDAHFFERRVLFPVNRKTVRTEVDMHALWLMAVLVELIAHRDNRDRKRADDEIKDVGASHADCPLPAQEFEKLMKRSSGGDSCRHQSARSAWRILSRSAREKKG
jgi:hypothetical protein